jgi:hypothetical protein
MQPAATVPTFMNDRQLEARYGIKRRHWQKMRMLGDGPPFRKVGRLCLYQTTSVDKWLAQQPLMVSTVQLAA